jgi:ribose-phosphate pyrophosphokinase
VGGDAAADEEAGEREVSLRVYSGTANPELAQRIAAHLGVTPGPMTVERFADGELNVTIGESTRDADVFIVQPTCPPVHEMIMELLVIIDAFKRASAQRITAVIPYYGYARQDKKLKPREPITAKLVANLIVTAGADRILAVDLHAGQVQGFFDVPVDHLVAAPIIGRYLIDTGVASGEVVVVSPDVGGVRRASQLAELLGAPIAIIAKRRPAPNEADVMEVVGDVARKTAILVDDMIDTAGSVLAGAEALLRRGAARIYAAATHPVFSGDAADRLDASEIVEIIVTDTIPLTDGSRHPKITILSVAELLARAIERIHRHMSVSKLFEH